MGPGLEIAFTHVVSGKPKKGSVTVPSGGDKGTAQFLLKTLQDIQNLSV